MSKVEKLADVLRDKKAHPGSELVKAVGHRFGAALLDLRKSGWEVISWRSYQPETWGEWLYRWTGCTWASYEPASPTCPKCGHKLHVKDVRREA